MATNSVQYLIEIKDRFSTNLRKMYAGTKNLNESVKKTSMSLQKMSRRLRVAGNSVGKFGRNLSLRATVPLTALAAMTLKASTNIETLETQFISITGSLENAKNTIKDLNDFTARTPFQLEEVANAARSLLSAGVSPEKLQENLQFLGDVSAISKRRIDELTFSFSKIKNMNRAQMEQLEIFASAGIPIMAQLAKTLNTTKEGVAKLSSQGKISFKHIEQALRSMNQEGQVAFKAMDNLSKTTAGRFSTFKDNVMFLSKSIGDTFMPQVKLALENLTKMSQVFDKMIQANPRLTKLVVILLGLLAVLGPLALALKGLLITFSFIITPIGGVALAISGLVVGITALIVYWDKIKKAFSQNSFLLGLIYTLNDIVGIIKDAITVQKLFFSGFKNPIKSFKGLKELFTTGFISGENKTKISGGIDINLNAPKGTVNKFSLKNKTKGLKLGLNMT